MSNTKLWDEVYRTDPAHAKDFKRAGGFSGTAITPLYLIHRATQMWGEMGGRWGAESAEHVISGNFVFVKAKVWYPIEGGRTGHVEHWGGDQLEKFDKPNDEAFKMAFTDAVVKALSWLGFSADIHMNDFDVNKYIDPNQRKADQAEKKMYVVEVPFSNGEEDWYGWAGNIEAKLEQAVTKDQFTLLSKANKPNLDRLAKIDKSLYDTLYEQFSNKHKAFLEAK